jgi:hypothetical protein
MSNTEKLEKLRADSDSAFERWRSAAADAHRALFEYRAHEVYLQHAAIADAARAEHIAAAAAIAEIVEE